MARKRFLKVTSKDSCHNKQYLFGYILDNGEVRYSLTDDNELPLGLDYMRIDGRLPDHIQGFFSAQAIADAVKAKIKDKIIKFQVYDVPLKSEPECTISKDVLKVLCMAPVDFDAFCSNPDNRQKLQSIEQELEGIATGAARAAAYISMRHGRGCGDQGHDSAVKDSNKVVAKVRKAFGYNITHPVRF